MTVHPTGELRCTRIQKSKHLEVTDSFAKVPMDLQLKIKVWLVPICWGQALFINILLEKNRDCNWAIYVILAVIFHMIYGGVLA